MNSAYSLNLIFVFLLSFLELGMLNAQLIPTIDTISIDTIPAFSVTAAPALIYTSRIRNPFTISTIDQKEIDRLAEPAIEPLINSIPGLWMQSGALNTNRISIRGVGYREPFATTGIKIYLDEIPLTNGAGESSIEDIHPLILSAIDVWRGPSSALWGSGLGGMIHLKSRTPQANSWTSGIQFGAYDRLQLDQNLSLRYGKDDQMATSFHYQWLHDSGYRGNNDYRKHSLTWMQQWMGGQQDFSISSFLHSIDLKAFIPSSLNESDYKNKPESPAPAWGAIKANEDYRKYIGGISLKFTNSALWVYNGAFYGTFFDSDEVRPFNVLNENNTAYGMRHRVTMNIRETSHISLGVEFFKEEYKFSTFETLEGGVAGEQLSDHKENRTYANSFLQSEFDLSDKWVLFAGLHLAFNKITNPVLQTDFPIGFYPTAGLNYLLNQNISLSGSISRGYSNFSLDDLLNSNGTIAPGIKPETGWSEEIAITIGDLRSTYGRLGFFHMNINNSIITLRIADDIFEKVNQGSSLHRGLELAYRIFPFSSKLDLEGSYTFQSYVTGKEDVNHLPGSPKHRSFHQLTYAPTKALDFYIIHHLVSDIFLNDANSRVGEGYQLWNAGLSYKFHFGSKWKVAFSSNVHNLFDTSYSPMFQANAPSPGGADPRYYYPGKPRSFYAGINLKYEL